MGVEALGRLVGGGGKARGEGGGEGVRQSDIFGDIVLGNISDDDKR